MLQLRNEQAVDVQPIPTAIERAMRVMIPHFRHQSRDLVGRDIGRIGQDRVEFFRLVIEPVADLETRAPREAQFFRVGLRLLDGARRYVDAEAGRMRQFVQQGQQQAAAARAEIEDMRRVFSVQRPERGFDQRFAVRARFQGRFVKPEIQAPEFAPPEDARDGSCAARRAITCSMRYNSSAASSRSDWLSNCARSRPSAWPTSRCASSDGLSMPAADRVRSASLIEAAASRCAQLRQFFRFVARGQFVDEGVEAGAVQDLVDIVERQFDAVVADPALREIIGADAFGTVARSHLALAFGRMRGVERAALAVRKGSRAGFHRLGAVLVLRTFVLHRDDDAGRQMGDAHRAFGFVDMLAARAGGTKDVDFQIFFVDRDIDIFHFRQDGDGRGGGMHAARSLRLRHALHAMHAGFELQPREDALAADLGDAFLEPAEIGLRDFKRLEPPAATAAYLRYISNRTAANNAASSPPAAGGFREWRCVRRRYPSAAEVSARVFQAAGFAARSSSISRFASACISGSASMASASASSRCARAGRKWPRDTGVRSEYSFDNLANSSRRQAGLRQRIAQFVMPRQNAGEGFGERHGGVVAEKHVAGRGGSILPELVLFILAETVIHFCHYRSIIYKLS